MKLYPCVALLLEMVTDFWALAVRRVVRGQCGSVTTCARTEGVPGVRQFDDLLGGF